VAEENLAPCPARRDGVGIQALSKTRARRFAATSSAFYSGWDGGSFRSVQGLRNDHLLRRIGIHFLFRHFAGREDWLNFLPQVRQVVQPAILGQRPLLFRRVP